MHDSLFDRVRPLRWTDIGLEVLDQRMLPDKTVYRLCSTADEVADAIATMQIRGAPAIGIAAAYAIVLAARDRFRESPQCWRESIETDFRTLADSRPTAVNLYWALERMRKRMKSLSSDPFQALLNEAQSLHDQDVAANIKMGALGAGLIGSVRGVLTHCNTGALATGGFGTALGVIRSLYRGCAGSEENGKADMPGSPASHSFATPSPRDAHPPFQVYATETRPWLQGARLTLWELEQDRIPATLIADSAAAFLMQQHRIQWVIVGADRIAANGDTANKIGTYGLAVAAQRHKVGFMVVAPTSTIDWNLAHGSLIPIEERDASELLPAYYCHRDSPTSAWNPVFDTTPAELISAIVTERGVVHHPSAETMQEVRE